MNESKQKAALVWLMNHAEHGRIPAYIGDEGRAYLIDFIRSGFESAKPEQAPPVIKHGAIEGEYNGTN